MWTIQINILDSWMLVFRKLFQCSLDIVSGIIRKIEDDVRGPYHWQMPDCSKIQSPFLETVNVLSFRAVYRGILILGKDSFPLEVVMEINMGSGHGMSYLVCSSARIVSSSTTMIVLRAGIIKMYIC